VALDLNHSTIRFLTFSAWSILNPVLAKGPILGVYVSGSENVVYVDDDPHDTVWMIDVRLLQLLKGRLTVRCTGVRL
jgi:hypothetical protein